MTKETSITPTRPPVLAPMDLGPAIESAVALGREGVEVLERLHAIRREELTESRRAAFADAMVQVSRDLAAHGPIQRSVPGQHGTTKAGTRTKGMYAPMDTIAPVLNPICARHGITYRFAREVIAGRDADYIVCYVRHASAHEEPLSKFPCPADTGPGRNAVQALGSGRSYAERYALCDAFGITTADPDDDGAGAGATPDPITEEQAVTLSDMIDGLIDEARAKFWRRMRPTLGGTEDISRLPSAKFDKVAGWLKAALEESGNA